MTIHEQETAIHSPTLGVHGEPCARCGAPLAHDQRYCLNCGLRRGDDRIPLERLAAIRESGSRVADARAAVVNVPEASWWRELPPASVGAALGALGLIFALGLLIGSLGDGGTKQVAATPPVIKVAAPAAAAAQPTAEFTGDWASDKDGYTVQLQTLPKTGTQPAQVAQAKSAAVGKGATDAGALDSDSYSSLDPGNYVIYAGVFDKRKQAKRALAKLKKSFPGAKVIHVSTGVASAGDAGALSGHKKEATVGKNQLKGLQTLSPDQYQKKSRKLPDTTKLPGKAPKKDEKAPGGGQGGAQVIG
jgi:hypothetical protein